MAKNKFSSDVIPSRPIIEFFTKRASFIHSYEKPALSILAEERQAFESNGQIYLTDESQEANFSDWAAHRPAVRSQKLAIPW